MQGLMQEAPLTLSMIFRRAEQLFPDKRIVTGQVGSPTFRGNGLHRGRGRHASNLRCQGAAGTGPGVRGIETSGRTP